MENENGKLGHVNRVATIYPIQFYNISTNTQNLTSNTQITKHILAPSAGSGQANNMDIATIQDSGIDAKIYYNHSDLLQSSSVMTDQTGAIAETLDYYPFGQIRIDKIAAPAGAAGPAAFTEQRKFIGQEFDQDTGLNYLNARYYNSALARFISQDPMFWNFNADWLSDPQTQNAYSYARNNPITGSDPSGLTPYFVPGFQAPIFARSQATDSNISQVMDWMTGAFGSQAQFYGWSQRDNETAISNAAQGLATRVMADIANGSGDGIVDFVGHSEGGRVAGQAEKILKGNGVIARNTIIGGTPIVKSDFDLGATQNMIVGSNADDPIQRIGGNFHGLVSASGIAGGIAGFGMCGPWCAGAGYIYGTILGYGQAGISGRTIKGADNVSLKSVIDNEQKTNGQRGSSYEHSATIFSKAAQNEYSNHIKK